MYRCNLQIAVFSNDAALTDRIRELQPLERFTHLVTTEHSAVPELIGKSDVIIWDLDTGILPSELRSFCHRDAVLVFCCSRRIADDLQREEFEAADEIWETPLRMERVRISMERILEHIKLQHDLYMTQTYLDTAIDSIPDMLWFKALDGAHVKVNKAFCSVVGKTREDVTGQGHCYIWGVSPDDFTEGEESCKASEEAVIKARRTLQFTEEVKCSKGMRQLRTYKTPIIDMDGVTILGTVGIGHDVTDLGNMTTELEILLQSMPYAIMIWDNDGRIINVNAKFEEYFTAGKETVVGRDYREWAEAALEKRQEVNSEGYIEARVLKPDKKEQVLEIQKNVIYDIFKQAVGTLCIFRDVTMERYLEKQILRSSNTDFLTGLYNRRYFYQYIQKNRRHKMVSLMYMDLDRFKAVNDTYGHKIGDAALVKTAKVLMEFFKDDFVARLGGDEFLMVRLGECSIDRLEREAGELLLKMQNVFQASEQMGILSASIGIAQSGDPGLDIDLLLQHSDQALYRAKKEGRSRYCTYHEA